MLEARTCEACGRLFPPPYATSVTNWTKRRFCSKRCAVGQPRPTRGVARRSPAERFWSKVAPRDATVCWEWTGAREVYGYGYLARTGASPRWKAHRLSWTLHNGPIPPGLDILHRCDNPPCCNPAHLFLGTQADNNRDRSAKGRGRENRQHGEANLQAKLARADVEAIIALVRGGISQAAAGGQFGISQPQVSRIVRGTSWRPS